MPKGKRWIHPVNSLYEEMAIRVYEVFQHPVLPWLPNNQDRGRLCTRAYCLCGRQEYEKI